MTTVITGWNSQIAVEFRNLLPTETFLRLRITDADIPVDADRYLFCHGMLLPKRAEDQTDDEKLESWEVNCFSTVRLCNRVLQSNPQARICVIGSESGYRGSFDGTYAEAKKKLHEFVETAVTHGAQQLVAISPWIIEDSGMTTARQDTGNLARRRIAHPMQRFLRAIEVANLAKHLLLEQAFISGTVIRMHGGLR